MKTNLNSTRRSIGAILMDSAGILGADSAERILKLQKEENLRFGDAAIRLGLLTEADLQFALSHQFDYDYLPSTGDRLVSDELVAAYQPFSHLVEQLRSLRSQLLLRWFDPEAGQNMLAVTSAARGEGRSYLAANLAIVFSQLGERTLLIDADLRAPASMNYSSWRTSWGFPVCWRGVQVLRKLSFQCALFSNLDVMPCGPIPPNPLELLNRTAFSALLATASKNYDVVLIDSSAQSSGADVSMVAACAGGAMVARNNETRMSAFRDLIESLNQAGVRVVGSVFNDPPLVKPEPIISSA